MKVSIVISVYNSHGVLDRQLKHFAKMYLPDDVEFIIMDDGSSPAHDIKDHQLNNLRIVPTNNKLAWTQGLGRNMGAGLATGEYLFMTDIDHIISKEAIEDVRNFSGAKMIFKRYFGVLLEDGTLTQDEEILKEYGFDPSKKRKNLYCSVHGNTFAIKTDIFRGLGGYSKQSCTVGFHPESKKGDDCFFNTKWNHYANANGLEAIEGSGIYMFPIGRYHINGDLNPGGLFHNLSQTKQEKHYKP